MPFRKFITKPCTIEAVQLTSSNIKEIKELIGRHNYVEKPWDPVNLHLDTGHGIAVCEVGDWVIKDGRGHYYPCFDSEFKAKYVQDVTGKQSGSA